MVVSDENVGIGEQFVQRGAALGVFKIQCNRALVARIKQPRIVFVALGQGIEGVEVTVGIAGARRFDVNDIGAKVAKHGACGRGCDKGGCFDYTQALQDRFHHTLPIYAAPIVDRPPATTVNSLGPWSE